MRYLLRRLDAHNQVIHYGTAESVFVQLPEEEAMRAWSAWQPVIHMLLEKSDTAFPEHLLS
jgi:hypothetical protein